MRLAVVNLWEVTVFICHRIKHDAKLLKQLFGCLVLSQVLFAVLYQLSLNLFDQFLLVDCILRLALLGYMWMISSVL